MKLALATTLALAAGCVDGLAPGELGLGRRLGVFPGEVAAVLPPMTDRAGNIYVATGIPDATGAPQPGVALTGGARGGWSEGCPTGTGPDGAARGWIGATAGRGWLWTSTAIVELDAVTGTCTTKLDVDPVSGANIRILAAPFEQDTVSGPFAVAMIANGTDPTPYLVTIDLDLGVIRDSTALPGATVLGAGADRAGDRGVFVVSDAASTRLVFAKPNAGIVAEAPVTGSIGALAGELAVGDDGSIAAVIGDGSVLVGTADGVGTSTMPGAVAVERDDDGHLWLVGDGPVVAPIADGVVGSPEPWTCAMTVDAELHTGVVVVDESGGKRTATKWQARSALGEHALLASRLAPPYAVGARAWLVADPPVDRGGIAYSQLAVLPIGVSFP